VSFFQHDFNCFRAKESVCSSIWCLAKLNPLQATVLLRFRLTMPVSAVFLPRLPLSSLNTTNIFRLCVFLSQAARHLMKPGSTNAIYSEVAAASVPTFRVPAAKTTGAGLHLSPSLGNNNFNRYTSWELPDTDKIRAMC
jgi:hypothetical protein